MYEFTIEELLAASVKFIKKYFWFFVIFLVLGIIWGFFKAKQQKPYYQADIYVGTGLTFFSPKVDNNINLLISDLTNLSTNLTDKQWIKKNFNQNNTKFISLSINFLKNKYNYTYPPIKLTLKTYSKDDFQKFKDGLTYYYAYKSPLLKLYKYQQELVDTLSKINFDSIVNKSNKYFIYSFSSVYDKIIKTYTLKQPLFYFTSDFSVIKYKKAKTTIEAVKYSLITLSLAIIIAFAIEFIKFSLAAYKKSLNQTPEK